MTFPEWLVYRTGQVVMWAILLTLLIGCSGTAHYKAEGLGVTLSVTNTKDIDFLYVEVRAGDNVLILEEHGVSASTPMRAHGDTVKGVTEAAASVVPLL